MNVTIGFAAATALLLVGCDGGGSPEQKRTDQRIVSPAPDRAIPDPFPSATRVRLYVEIKYSKEGKPIWSRPAGRALDRSQRAAFERALYLTTPADDTTPACFIPHHFFRYYDKSGKQVGEVAVCFCCEGVQATGEANIPDGSGQVLSARYDQVEDLVRAMGEPTDLLCD